MGMIDACKYVCYRKNIYFYMGLPYRQAKTPAR